MLRLVQLCNGDQQHRYLIESQEHGIVLLLEELASNGTERGKRKMTLLLFVVSIGSWGNSNRRRLSSSHKLKHGSSL